MLNWFKTTAGERQEWTSTSCMWCVVSSLVLFSSLSRLTCTLSCAFTFWYTCTYGCTCRKPLTFNNGFIFFDSRCRFQALRDFKFEIVCDTPQPQTTTHNTPQPQTTTHNDTQQRAPTHNQTHQQTPTHQRHCTYPHNTHTHITHHTHRTPSESKHVWTRKMLNCAW